jgi:hypothetical protein
MTIAQCRKHPDVLAAQVVSFLAEKIHDKRVRKDCVLTLCNLSYGTNSSQMTTDGATHTLCELCDLHVSINMERISVVFRNLASHQGNVRRMVGAGVVPTLVAIASKGSVETKLHCLVGLCLISFEPTVRLSMAEEGAIPTIMELSRYIGNRAAVHYCGMAISNIAAEPKAQAILVKAGAILTLMEWMDHQTSSNNTNDDDDDFMGGGGEKKKKNRRHHKQEESEEELMRRARQRAAVPPVEPSELEPLSERFEEPRVKFAERSLPWRKFHIQLKVVEPEPPPMPAIARPVIGAKKKRKKRRASTPGGTKIKKKNKDNDGKKKEKEAGKDGEEDAIEMLLKRTENPQDVENHKILSGLKGKIVEECKPTVLPADESIIDELKAKDVASWARRTQPAIVHAHDPEGKGGEGKDDGPRSPLLGEGEGDGSGPGTGFEGLFASMRTGSMPIMDPPKSPLFSSRRDGAGGDGYQGGDMAAMANPHSRSAAFGTSTVPQVMPEDSMGSEMSPGPVPEEGDVFFDFENTMQDVRHTNSKNNRTTARNTADFGTQDFMQHLDGLIDKF